MALAGPAMAAAAQELPAAIAALDAGRVGEAALMLSEIVRQHPEDSEANYYLGVAHLRGGRAGEARPFLEKAVSRAPGNAAAWRALGMAAATGSDLNGAVQAFGKACALAPRHPESCYFHGRSLYLLGHYREAQHSLEQALRNGTAATRAKVHRAAALNYLGLIRPDKAESHFREAVRWYSGKTRPEEDPRIDYGSFLVREGRATEGLLLLQAASKAHPTSARAHSELGKALLDLGKPEGAAKSLEISVALDPSGWAARLLLGRAYLQLGRAAEAERELRLGRQGWTKQNAGPPTAR